MVDLPSCVIQCRAEVLRLQIRLVGQDLLAAQAIGLELQHIPHADAHAANAGLPAALLRVGGDA
jgi:hypothetical protein